MNTQETPQYKILLAKPMTLNDLTKDGKVIWKVVKGKYGNFLVLNYVLSSDEHFTILGEACSFYPSKDMRNGIALSDINVFNQYVKDNLDKIKIGIFYHEGRKYNRFYRIGTKTEIKNKHLN